MSACNIIVDSCSYFRLAQSIRPLLKKAFDISTYKTLELLKLMHNNGFLTMKQIRAIAAYWVYQNDMPKSYRKDFKRIFSEEPPR